MIPKDDFEKLILNVDVGQSTAEQDRVLEHARIETPIFMELYLDKVDLVLGTKGSGKTALFVSYNKYLKEILLAKKNVVIISGVEPQGDPVFEAYRSSFELLAEDEFQNFWRIYFISLFNKDFLENPVFEAVRINASIEIKTFQEACQNANLPLFPKSKSFKDLIEGILDWLRKIKLKPAVTAPDGATYSIEVSSSQGAAEVAKKVTYAAQPIFLNEITQSALSILEKMGLSVWIMLDRLDEVFQRRSPVEMRALRALLQTMRSFYEPKLRLKIFLRDDIFNDLTVGGLTGLTHITDRCAPPMKWSQEDILRLIVKRIFSETIAKYFDVDPKKLDKDESYAKECFYKVFPAQVESGPKQSETIKWIYKRCADGKGVVTPRDVIDLLRFARNQQEEMFTFNPQDQKYLICAEALEKGFELLSARKRDTYLFAEYPDIKPYIEKIIGKKSEYDKDSLRKMFGDKCDDVITFLCAIGFFEFRVSTNTYLVPHLFRSGLKIKQGKAFKKKV